MRGGLDQLLSFQLPIHLYESLIEILDGQPHILYTHVSYSLATEEAERIGVDHIARSSVTGTTHTSAGMHVWLGGCDCGWGMCG